ncbi:MAG: hypothetical protein CVT63_00225 [Candidatus Anoxymicrobium japonicum]|uniref:BPL/LPL catalytic domain-containing protein n=1 Tax=Candidatus Anoxymicrobium japonicum TaxID=2013648 RepID=A0A2N3G893_9ACTN|nr:MAG: hypothetical protein CVT63_00225 [Candidatus Anoxymicrobium japonicum]
METWRFIIDSSRAGALNMAVDRALAVGAAETELTTLRVYSFSPPAITIGRFQAIEEFIDLAVCEKEGIDVVRRPTGGLAILHMNDFTYSVTSPATSSHPIVRDKSFKMLSGGIVEALRCLGLATEIVSHGVQTGCDGWCFGREFGVDIEWRSRKICGSASRIADGALLQHGSLFFNDNSAFLRRVSTRASTDLSEHVPVSLREACGREITWLEVAAAFQDGFSRALGIEFETAEVTVAELEMAARRM